MSLCVSCGLEQGDQSELCHHHLAGQSSRWAASNRIMCDFFHRGKVPPRLNTGERADEFWAVMEAA
jgi:hypothetical protein